jgi:hypothetical protein
MVFVNVWYRKAFLILKEDSWLESLKGIEINIQEQLHNRKNSKHSVKDHSFLCMYIVFQIFTIFPLDIIFIKT